MHPALRALLTEPVLYAPAQTSADGYGTVTYGPVQILLGRIERRTDWHRGPTGIEVMSQTRLFLDSTVPIQAQDRLTLPDGTTPPIVRVDGVPGLDGLIDHYEIYF